MKPIEEKGLIEARKIKKWKRVSWFDDCRIPFEGIECAFGRWL